MTYRQGGGEESRRKKRDGVKRKKKWVGHPTAPITAGEKIKGKKRG